ncbi:uncharacterized protein LOC142182631 isoform X1 [Nicotiana tabacum]|uniref:Uncharacterized protein LOC142182631 isoform X1 n=2 Tax=Nicotiana TaxID=4085 RepID=A0AC58UU36_TOBAC|nr:PREDICTED: splicing factor, suppressor of white-apricot homolog isoform X1 [Nicotiana sylvestris]
MDLEVVGRHALLFDDDAMAAFVNSDDALVEWNSLQIDRYDVRHLLSAPPPSRRRSHSSTSSNLVDASIQFELDHERYLDLPSPSDEPEVEEDEKSVDAGAYRAVGFSYGHTDDSAYRKSSEVGQESSEFRPSFPVPESLLQCLPPTEKVHQIIARTALFVSKHGGQSEIVLRVKQGDNPTFGFLIPDHDLHAYFRFLVDHPELLQPGSDVKAQNEVGKDSNEQKEHDGRGGALSLLGSVYESGEDEELANGDDPGSKVTSATLDTLSALNVSSPIERADSSKEFEKDEKEKDERVSTNSLRSSKDKEKAAALKKNNLINASKSGIRSNMRKEDDGGSSAASRKTKAEVSGLGVVSKTGPLVEPPSDLKKLINKIVEFILKNGKQFESTLMEQDSKHGRFPFLLPTNQYHPYYLKILQKALESKVHGSEKRALKESDSPSRSAGYDLPYVSDKKEKFKMVIGKSKKEMQDSLTRTSEQEVGVNVDAAAAAAILHAATRGIKNPNLNIISGSSKNGDSQGHSSEGGQASSFLNVPPFSQRSDQRMKNSVSIPKAKEIAKSAAAEAASEADSSEAHLSKEQKLKAERLRRAKMFVALLKGGAAPVKRDSSHGGSVEPQESALSGSGTEVNAATREREGSAAPSELTALGREGSAAPSELTALEREGSAAPLINNVSNENEKSEIKHNAEENERRSRRKYRSRSDRPDEEDEEEEGEGEEEEKQLSRKKHHSSREDEEEESGEVRDDRRSKKKRRSHRHRHKDGGNAYEDEDDEDKRSRKKHRRRHSSPEYDEDDDEDDKRSRKKHRRRHSSPEDDDDDDEDDKRSRKKHRRRHSSPEYDDDDDERRDAERHHKHGRKKHSSHQSSPENRKDDYEEDYKHSKKKHRSHRTSHRSREKLKHRPKHFSDDESEHGHKRPNSSDDEKQHYGRANKNEKGTKEREELEEGEIGTKVSDQSRGSPGGSVSREASVDVSSSHQRAASQHSESTEISDDLRAKIRAMLMATRK